MIKIFQIGFNKCGTSSIHHLFSKYTTNRIKSIHWDNGFLAKSMYDRMLAKESSLLSDWYQQYSVFTDMESIFIERQKLHIVHMYEYFKILDQQYPGSKFILNTRHIDNWIQSRLKHKINSIIINNQIVPISKKILYWQLYTKLTKTPNKDDIVELWKNQWNHHHNNVIQYFIDRPKDLLIYNIDIENNLNKFINFFQDIKFTTSTLPQMNKSA